MPAAGVDDTQMAGAADSQNAPDLIRVSRRERVHGLSTIHKVGFKGRGGKADLHSHVCQLVISCRSDMFSEDFLFFFSDSKVKSEVLQLNTSQMAHH